MHADRTRLDTRREMLPDALEYGTGDGLTTAIWREAPSRNRGTLPNRMVADIGSPTRCQE
jgi:hypothetical protein